MKSTANERPAPASTVPSKVQGAAKVSLPALNDKQLGAITGLAAAGATEASIARSLGLTQSRWRELKKADDRVADALAEGVGVDLNIALHALRTAALTEAGKMRKGGMVALLCYLKFKHHMRDHGPAADAGNAGGPRVVINMPGALSHADYARMVDVTPAQEAADGTKRTG